MSDNKKKSAVRQYARDVGEAWSKSNADFEKTKPGLVDRAARVLNPLTGMGSSLGMMYEAGKKGDKTGMAIAAVSAIPAAGYAKVLTPAKSLIPTAGRVVSDVPKTARGLAANTVVGVSADKYEITERPPMSKKWMEKGK